MTKFTDLAMNAFPLRVTPGLPIFAEDMQEVKNSWNLLLDKGARQIYPAHGNPFSAEIIRKNVKLKDIWTGNNLTSNEPKNFFS